MASKYGDYVTFPDLYDLVARKRNGYNGRNCYEMEFRNKVVALFRDGILSINVIDREFRHTSIRRAMKCVHNHLTKGPKRYAFKDVKGLQAFKHSVSYENPNGIYDIRDENGHLLADLNSHGTLTLGREVVGEKMSLHNAIRLVFLKTQKPIGSQQSEIVSV